MVSSLAVHHLSPELRPVALREIHRVLRPDGRLLLADFRPPTNRIANHLIGALSGHAMSHNPIEALPSLVEEAGFTILDTGDRWPLLRYISARRVLN